MQVFLGDITEVLAELLSYAKTSGEGCSLPRVLRRNTALPRAMFNTHTHAWGSPPWVLRTKQRHTWRLLAPGSQAPL